MFELESAPGGGAHRVCVSGCEHPVTITRCDFVRGLSGVTVSAGGGACVTKCTSTGCGAGYTARGQNTYLSVSRSTCRHVGVGICVQDGAAALL